MRDLGQQDAGGYQISECLFRASDADVGRRGEFSRRGPAHPGGEQGGEGGGSTGRTHGGIVAHAPRAVSLPTLTAV